MRSRTMTGGISLLHSGTGMYLLGMTFGWAALRVLHTRKCRLSTTKKFSASQHTPSRFPTVARFPGTAIRPPHKRSAVHSLLRLFERLAKPLPP